MQYPLRVLELTNAITEETEWTRHAEHDGCPDIDDLYNPTVATLCITEQTVEGDYTSQKLILNYLNNTLSNIFFANYSSYTWLWYNHPEPRLITGSLLTFNAVGLPGEVRASIVEEMREMVFDLRDDVNLPLAPDELPPRWVQGEALPGGLLIHWGFLYFYTRYPLTAEQNIISPTNDTRHTRFLPFNQGVMQTPDADITMERVLETTYTEFDDINKVHIDWDKQYLYIVPDPEVMRLDVDRFSLFSAIGGDARLIARINHRDEWIPENLPNTVGWRLRFDIKWRSGAWDDGLELTLGFSASE